MPHSRTKPDTPINATAACTPTTLTSPTLAPAVNTRARRHVRRLPVDDECGVCCEGIELHSSPL